MFKKVITLATTAFLLTGNVNFAQEVTANVTHALSKKASKAELYNYVIDEENDLISMPYLLKDGKKSILLETYKFKLSDLSFISVEEEEVDKEKSIYTKKSKGSGYTRILKVKPNYINGKIKLQRGYLSGGYAGRAYITAFNVEEEINVVTPKGDKFIYLTHKTEEPDMEGRTSLNTAGTTSWGYTSLGEGNVSIVGMEKEKPYYSKYGFTIYDAETLREKTYQSFDLEYSCAPITVKQLPNGNTAMIFQSIRKDLLPRTKGAEEKFNIDPEHNFHFVELNTEGETVHRVKFQMEATEGKDGLNCIDIIPTQNPGEIVLLGLKKSDENGTFIQLNPKFLGPNLKDGSTIELSVKADKVVVMKIKDGKMIFSKTHPINVLTNNQQVQGDTKAPTDGLKYVHKSGGITSFGAYTAKNGNTLISTKCRDFHHLIELDEQGALSTNYISQSTQDWSVNNIVSSNAKEDLYWIHFDMPSYKDDASSEDKSKAIAQRTGFVSKLDENNHQISKTISMTPEGVTLDPYDALKRIDDNNILILGQGKKREISLSKIALN